MNLGLRVLINFKHLSQVEAKKLDYVCSCQNEWICARYTDICKSSTNLHVGRNAFAVVLFFFFTYVKAYICIL